MVFVQHYILSVFPALWQWGWAGVDVFFVLSGFLITGILFDMKDSTHRFRNFYARRTLRIFPLYYGVLLVIFLLSPIMRWSWNITWIYWPLYLGNYVRFLYAHAFIQSGGMLEALYSPIVVQHLQVRLFLGHFWSLGVEEQFYMCWPLVVFAVKDRLKLRNICLATICILPVIRLIASFYLPHELFKMQILSRITPFRIDSLLLGGGLALILRGPEERYLARIVPKLVPVCVVLLATAPIMVPVLFHSAAQENAMATWTSSFGLTVIDLLSGCVIWVSLQSGSSLFNVLRATPLRRLGEISYGFYVFHDIPRALYVALALWLAGQRPLLAFILTILIGFASTLVLSYLSFRFFESPFLRLKQRFATI